MAHFSKSVLNVINKAIFKSKSWNQDAHCYEGKTGLDWERWRLARKSPQGAS
jgi:hypothetical protein